MLSTLAVYSIFDFFLFLSDGLYSGFKGSDLRSNIATAGWVLVFATPALGGFLLTKFLKDCFPVVIFHGRISDNNKVRNRAAWVLSAIILPILLNVGTSMIDGAVKSASEIQQTNTNQK